jgi:hypothetical protein
LQPVLVASAPENAAQVARAAFADGVPDDPSQDPNEGARDGIAEIV